MDLTVETNERDMNGHKMDFVLNEETNERVKKEAPREEAAKDMNAEPSAAVQGKFDSEFANLYTKLDAGFARIHARLDGTDGRIDNVEGQLWEIKES